MQYKLKFPVEIGDKLVEEVTIKEKWNAGDMIECQNAGNGAGDRACRQVALALDWGDPLVKKLSVDDYMAIVEISNGFFMPNSATAKVSS
jgi:hypothetical protein